MLYFPIYKHFTLRYYSALGPTYMSKLLCRVIRTFTASWCCNETNCKKYGDNEWRLCQHRHWQILKNQKKATMARKTILNKDASDQWGDTTDSNSMVLKIKAPVPWRRASVPLYKTQGMVLPVPSPVDSTCCLNLESVEYFFFHRSQTMITDIVIHG